MAFYVTKRCPQCGHAYQVFESGDQRKYGCPLQICEKCDGFYWDTDIKEPALYGYDNVHEDVKSVQKGCSFVFCILMSLMSICGGIYTMITESVILGLLFLGMGASFVWAIVSVVREAKYNNEHQYEILLQQRREYDASMERLQNNNYLEALAELDSHAKKLLKARRNGEEEIYAQRP